MKIDKKVKLLIAGTITAAFLAAAPFVLYLEVLPHAVASPKTTAYVSKVLKKHAGVDLVVKNARLDTSLTPVLGFNVAKVSLSKDKKEVFNLENFGIELSLSEIFKKRIIINQLGADYIFADIDALSSLMPAAEKGPDKKTEFDWDIDLFSAKMFVKECLFTYKANDTSIRLRGKDFEINNQDAKNYIHFKFFTEFEKNNKKVIIAAADRDTIYIENHKINVDNFAFFINRSKITVNAYADNKKQYYLEAAANNFNIKDIIEIIESNLIINNGSEMLAGFKDLNGSFNSKIVIANNKIDGKVTLNNFSCKLIPLNNLPLKLNSGIALINNKDIILKDVVGYYGSGKENSLNIYGGIYDYFKTAKTVITTDATVTNEFAAQYLSKVVGYPFSIIGKGGARIVFEALGTKMDLTFLCKLAKGSDFLVDGASLSPASYDRAAKAVMHFEGDNINIETIDYYIAEVIDKGSKLQPILTLDGNVRITDGFIRDLGFNIPKPLPSEFLNIFMQQKVFRKGTIAGNLRYINTGAVPKIKGDMTLKDIRIPAQRLFIKEAKLQTNKGSIILSSNGRYRRTSYDVSGNLLNEIKLPIVVNSIKLKIDELDIEKIMASFNRQYASTEINQAAFTTVQDMDDDDDSDVVAFNPGMLIIKECIFNVVKGSYKGIDFANLVSNLSLDKNGVLKVESNKFDIAEGISSAKIVCDLKKHLYSVRLGIKDVNSDIMATSLLALEREISGKASGLIELNTDDSMKLNGSIKFAIKNGTIQKIGLVEYVLKFTALFRNPLAMISPATFMDLVNVPEGKFEKISGELFMKDNVVERMKIQSSAAQLSSLIVGRFDLESRDASLRIYTKMSNRNKGFAGALRNISLNSLANRVPLSGRNDSNYYAAELSLLPEIDADEKDCQVFLIKADGDVEHNNFLSSLKRIK